MPRKKSKPKKDHTVFMVAGAKASKAKKKTKPVATTLKKLSVEHNKTKTEKADERFAAIQEIMAHSGKQEKNPTIKSIKHKKDDTKSAVDMDLATEEFSKL